MNERERRLDVGLLQSGKFAEALAGLEKWLADTEDMVNNQKPPSSDYKVVKAQLQEQKVQKELHSFIHKFGRTFFINLYR
jgi:dystonin